MVIKADVLAKSLDNDIESYDEKLAEGFMAEQKKVMILINQET